MSTTYYNMSPNKTYTPDFMEIVTPPSTSVVELDTFKEHLGDTPESDLFLQEKLDVATIYVEEMLGFWLRSVRLKAVSQRIPKQLYLPGGRIPFASVTAFLTGLENHELVNFYVFGEGHKAVFYLSDCPDFTINQTRLEVSYTINPIEAPAPVKEAIMKAASHLYHVRGTDTDKMKEAKYEIKSLIKPWIRRTGFKRLEIR